MNSEHIETFLSCNDRDFVCHVLLRRAALSHDPWYQLDELPSIISSIILSTEFIEKNSLFADQGLFLPYHDKTIPASIDFVRRAYDLLLGIELSADNMPEWATGDFYSLNAVCADVCSRSEFFLRVRSPIASHWTPRQHAKNLNIYANYVCHDSYNLYAKEKLDTPSQLSNKLQNLKRDRIKVEILIVDEIPKDRSHLEKQIRLHHPLRDIELLFTSSNLINERGLSSDTDIFITSNDNLYTTFDSIKSILSNDRSVVSACWLTDNHHQFPLSLEACEVFDFAFPAHYNMHSYLYGGRAEIGPAVPCGIFQWSRDQAEHFYQSYRKQQRSNELYGKHTAYHGRVTARGKFINAVKNEFPKSQVQFLTIDEQNWFSKTAEDRFIEMASHKVALSVPVNNDVSMRIFDTLLTGQIPILPFGLPGLEAAIPLELQRSLPVIFFQPNDVISLRQAYEKAIAAYDAGGIPASDARHYYALNSHFGYRRLGDILNHILTQV